MPGSWRCARLLAPLGALPLPTARDLLPDPDRRWHRPIRSGAPTRWVWRSRAPRRGSTHARQTGALVRVRLVTPRSLRAAIPSRAAMTASIGVSGPATGMSARLPTTTLPATKRGTDVGPAGRTRTYRAARARIPRRTRWSEHRARPRAPSSHRFQRAGPRPTPPARSPRARPATRRAQPSRSRPYTLISRPTSKGGPLQATREMGTDSKRTIRSSRARA